MLKKNRPELLFVIIGCLSCICNGGNQNLSFDIDLDEDLNVELFLLLSGIQPAFGVILSKVIAVRY